MTKANDTPPPAAAIPEEVRGLLRPRAAWGWDPRGPRGDPGPDVDDEAFTWFDVLWLPDVRWLGQLALELLRGFGIEGEGDRGRERDRGRASRIDLPTCAGSGSWHWSCCEVSG